LVYSDPFLLKHIILSDEALVNDFIPISKSFVFELQKAKKCKEPEVKSMDHKILKKMRENIELKSEGAIYSPVCWFQ
jgi:hypothetical protein